MAPPGFCQREGRIFHADGKGEDGGPGVKNWTRVRTIIEAGRAFVVTSHVYPDGDSIGSTLAFLRLLKAMGKRAAGIMPSPVPESYHFLPGAALLRTYRPGHDASLAAADAVFMLDASTNDRLGALDAATRRLHSRRICIDHHPGNTVDAETRAVDPGACSTAQLIYELYGACGVRIDRATALSLYTGIHTDTVSFNFLGTNAVTHEIAADLLRRGVDPKSAWLKMYGHDSPRLLRLAGLTLAGLHTAARGHIAWMTIRERHWRRLRVDPKGTESFTRYPLTLQGVDVIAVFCEEGRERIRMSLRALDRTDVGEIARSFGGGGHRTSAGAMVSEPLACVVSRVIRRLSRQRPVSRPRRKGKMG
jgi:phosphoesterase RecJ-like protein